MLMAGLFTLSVTGCMKKEFFDSSKQEPEQKPEKDDGKVTLDDYFDFSTTQEVRLKVDYGSGCPKAYFEVYAENPLVYQEEGAQVTKRKDIIHIAGGFTDGDGKYDKSVTIPASVSDVYIYSPDFGVPKLYKAEVIAHAVNATISFDNEIDVSILSRSRAATGRAATVDFIKKSIPNVLGTWKSKNGKPDYLDDGLKINISAELKKNITGMFPEGKDNGNSPYISHDTDILIKEKARVWINYFGGDTSARSVFAYYCYESGASVADINQAVTRACVIFPSAHKDALGSYSGVGTYLRYIDSGGNLHPVEEGFPAGTKIGFLLWNQGFGNSTNFNNNTFYSTQSLNSDGRSHTAIFAATASSGKKYNIITMEDWINTDYNDVAFVISSDPIRAIDVPDAPDQDDDRKGTNLYRGVLGFEDNWPKQGDYDLNDVVIKYISEVSYNDKNQILDIVDKFTLVWSGASYNNGFSYQVPFSLDLLKVLDGEASHSSDNVINVFDNAREELGVSGMAPADMPSHAGEIRSKTFTVTMKFDVPYAFGVTPPYNPFIRLGNTEVHLPNRPPTANANNTFPQEADISDGKTTFFICEDGYPFALHMDARADESIMNINLKPEAVRIDVTYPGFSDWVKTRNPQTKWW